MDSFKNFCSPQFHCMNLWNHIDTLLSISLLYVLEKMNINFHRAGGILKHVANQFTRFDTCRKRIYVLLAHMSRKEFTHFVRKVFARKSLPTGKLRLFRSLQGVPKKFYIALLEIGPHPIWNSIIPSNFPSGSWAW